MIEIIEKSIIPRPEVAEALERLKFQRFMSLADLPKSEKGFCRWCGKKCPGKRYTWCSGGCNNEFSIRWSGSSVKWRIRERDKGICAICGIDTIWLQHELEKIYDLKEYYLKIFDIKHFGAFEKVKNKAFYRTDSLWEADHIIPVILGGGCCGLDNYRTLCIKCHKQKTAELAKKRAAERNEDPNQMALFNN